VRTLLALVLLAGAVPARSLATPGPAACMRGSGNAGTRCLRDYVGTIEPCRLRKDAACETAARADGGPIDTILADTAGTAGERCTDASAFPLDYPSLDDLELRVPEACADFGDDLLDIAFADSASGRHSV